MSAAEPRDLSLQTRDGAEVIVHGRTMLGVHDGVTGAATLLDVSEAHAIIRALAERFGWPEGISQTPP